MIFFGQIKNQKLDLVNGLQLKQFLKNTEGKQIQVIIEERPSTISPIQRSSLHLWLSHLAAALNSSGCEKKQTLKINIPYTKHSVKKDFWEPVQKAVLQTDDSEQLTHKAITDIYEILNREIGENTGVNVPWPEKRKVENQLELKYN